MNVSGGLRAPGKEAPVPVGRKAGGGGQSQSGRDGEERIPAPTGDLTPVVQLVTQVTTLRELPRLLMSIVFL